MCEFLRLCFSSNFQLRTLDGAALATAYACEDADLGSRQAQLASLVSDDRLEIRRLLPAGHNSAVDGEHDAGNETRLIGGEKQQRFGCVRRLAIATKRVHRVEGRQHSFHLLGCEERAE